MLVQATTYVGSWKANNLTASALLLLRRQQHQALFVKLCAVCAMLAFVYIREAKRESVGGTEPHRAYTIYVAVHTYDIAHIQTNERFAESNTRTHGAILYVIVSKSHQFAYNTLLNQRNILANITIVRYLMFIVYISLDCKWTKNCLRNRACVFDIDQVMFDYGIDVFSTRR